MSLSNASDHADETLQSFAVGAGNNPGTTGTSRPFVDRRRQTGANPGQAERRQFGSSHSELTAAGRELAVAIDQYKIQHHRRYLTCDEMLRVISSLGYAKQ